MYCSSVVYVQFPGSKGLGLDRTRWLGPNMFLAQSRCGLVSTFSNVLVRYSLNTANPLPINHNIRNSRSNNHNIITTMSLAGSIIKSTAPHPIVCITENRSQIINTEIGHRNEMKTHTEYYDRLFTISELAHKLVMKSLVAPLQS
jgi:hypothetical protein